MATERVADMTVEELRLMIDRAVERKMHEFEHNADPRTLAEILESIDRNMLVPQPGTPATLELLRADRDR